MQSQHQMLYRTAMMITKKHHDSMDAVSETILSCWENIPKLKNKSYFKTWMTRILINKCNDILRERNKYISFEQQFESQADTVKEYDLDTSLDIESTMYKMCENDRLILCLFYFDDFSVRQISQTLSISESAVKTRLSRSRQSFKKLYTKGRSTTHE